MGYYKDNHITVYNKDCRSMAELPDESIQCVVTSPPYWGLRKYAGLPDLVWGGKEDCQHEWGDSVKTGDNRFRGKNANVGSQGNPEVYAEGKALSSFCSLCGDWKGQLGLEPTPEMYIEHLVSIFREVRRVLRKDGVCFINIGDSYMSGGGPARHWGYADPKNKARGIQDYEEPTAYPHKLVKPKDLCLIPFRLAIALQTDGWWVRSAIIWNKPNPMPESVTDRPTESHEYILMLTKSAKYYWDAEAVREPLQASSIERSQYDTGWNTKALVGEKVGLNVPHYRGFKTKHSTTFGEQEQYHGQGINSYPSGRNLRSVWTFPTQPYKEAHFATYPEELVKRCVKAATPEVGCCSKCGKPWLRIIKSQKGFTNGVCNGCGQSENKHIVSAKSSMVDFGIDNRANTPIPCSINQTLGWRPQCKCNADKSPSVVLDPFAGSGTTLWVAKKLNRKAVGYELSKEYCQLIIERNRQQGLL